MSVSGDPVVHDFVVSSNTTLTISTGFTASGSLVLNSNLDPNGQGVSLSNTGTLVEGSGVFYGTSGYTTTTRDLSNIDEDVAGLGAKITTSVNMGSTIIKREHVVQTNNSANSVKRYYQITPKTDTGLNATLMFNYETDELNSLTEADLELYKSTDNGSTWALAGGTVSTANNTVTLSSIDGFSRWTLFDEDPPPLPVELTTFTASLSEKKVHLFWQTETEVNNIGFEIERKYQESSIENQDEKHSWETIGFVKGYGHSNSPKYYSFTDENINVNENYLYRLKQIDNDGSYSYSQIIEPVKSVPSSFSLSQNYPNPFNPTTIINYSLPNESNVTLKVYNSLGQEVAFLVNRKRIAGSYDVVFDGSKLTSGMYYYSIKIGNFTSVKKMMLVK